MPALDVFLRALADRRAEWRWLRTDRTGPLPARQKRDLLRSYARQFRLEILVETGTYLGDTVAAMRHEFTRIYSIELAHHLAHQAQKRFREAPNVTIIEGDSGSVLPDVVDALASPALFWLDGHYSAGTTARGSADCPVLAEIDTIVRHRIADHVVLIDDANWVDAELGGDGLEQIRRRIASARPNWTVAVRNDIVRTHTPLRGLAAAVRA